MKKFIKILIVVIAILFIVVYGVYSMFYDTQRINGQQEIGSYSSPQGTYTITAYLNDGGATSSYAVLCSVQNTDTGKGRNIYWQDNCNYANVKWVDDNTVNINGIELDVQKDTYDFRHDL